ncbi:uncharacterized protein LOC124164394 [Ischnura elegans]|uniref:uncharacterized protein LOC124164394 n=1 Tax=Ischnura elegans TaxID=197161 RepID=UPI001ED87810|nr:uncharacterized protein LOC124164394 [Ischnura elegans]
MACVINLSMVDLDYELKNDQVIPGYEEQKTTVEEDLLLRSLKNICTWRHHLTLQLIPGTEFKYRETTALLWIVKTSRIGRICFMVILHNSALSCRRAASHKWISRAEH